MNARSMIWAWLALLLCGAPAWAQGVLVIVNHPHPIPLPRPIIRPTPMPAPTYRIKELSIQGKVTDQVARIQVGQSFVNTGSTAIQVQFVFPLPPSSAIDQLTFLVDGKEIEGKLMAADKARSIYEGYVRQNKDPALLEWLDHGMFQTSIFPVPAGAERKISLRYSQLLRKNNKLTDFLFPLATAKYTSQPIEDVKLEVSIESQDKIKSVYSPNFPIHVERPDERRAVVKWEAKQTVPTQDFRLFYDTDPGPLSASVVSYRPDKDDEGYFLLLASPDIKAEQAEIAKKTVVFVVDRSGSMSGKKIEQAKEALKFVMNNLREGDLFNIVAYDSDVETFRPELEKFSDTARQQALGFIEGLYAGGSTNIDGALTRALEMLQDKSQPTFVIFLTDGLPTVGEQNESKIVASATEKNKVNARILSFGVGYDVNSRLLDRLVNENNGTSHYVRPDEDLEAHVSQLYGHISAPIMTDVQLTFDMEGAGDGELTSRLYPKKVNDLFAGQQLVLVGRYKKAGDAKVVIKGRVGSSEKSFDFPAKFVEHSSDASHGFVEKLWAMRRIGEIIDEIDLRGKNDELVQELVTLSTRHGIITPYTAFLADENQRPDLANVQEQLRQTDERLSRLSVVEGRGGFAQRAQKQAFRRAESLVPLSASPASPAAAGGLGGTAAGAAMGMPGRSLRVYDAESEQEVDVDTVQSVGNETLFKRGQLWIASSARDVDLEKQKAEIQEVERFSEAYFRLTADNTPAENAVLAVQKDDEQLLMRLRGKIYLIK